MYFIECFRENKHLFIWANMQDLNEWSVSEKICFFKNYTDAKYVFDLLSFKSKTNLSNVKICYV